MPVLPGGDPIHLHDWCVLAEEVEIDQNRSKYRGSKGWKRSSHPQERRREAAKGQVQLQWSSASLKGGREGHQAAECQGNHPIKKMETTLAGKPVRAQPRGKERALRSSEVVEFTPSPHREDRTPTPPVGDQGRWTASQMTIPGKWPHRPHDHAHRIKAPWDWAGTKWVQRGPSKFWGKLDSPIWNYLLWGTM